jgi:DNA-binding NarL/FixJ family response regulator
MMAKRQVLQLTGREKEILCYLQHGRASREIAELLIITERTVKFHIGNCLRKLCAANRTQAVVLALEKGMLG